MKHLVEKVEHTLYVFTPKEYVCEISHDLIMGNGYYKKGMLTLHENAFNVPHATLFPLTR